MERLQRVTCPHCHSEKAVIAYRLSGGGDARFCPDCEYTWDAFPTKRPGTDGVVPHVRARGLD